MRARINFKRDGYVHNAPWYSLKAFQYVVLDVIPYIGDQNTTYVRIAETESNYSILRALAHRGSNRLKYLLEREDVSLFAIPIKHLTVLDGTNEDFSAHMLKPKAPDTLYEQAT